MTDPMPEGYEPSLSGSIAVHRIPNKNPDNGPMYRAVAGDMTFITDDICSTIQRGTFILDHPTPEEINNPNEETFLGFSARTPIEAHREHMIKHLHYLIQSEGIYL